MPNFVQKLWSQRIRKIVHQNASLIEYADIDVNCCNIVTAQVDKNARWIS